MKPAALLALVALLGGSSPSQGGELSAVEIKSARKLYLAKCTKCHKLYNPADYSSEQWDEWMVKMSKKSRLKPVQTGLLARYIAAAKAGEVELPRK